MNPAQEVQENGKAHPGARAVCRVCKRVLRHPRSIAIGMGKTCGRKFPGTYQRLANEAEGQQSFVSDDGSVIAPTDETGGKR